MRYINAPSPTPEREMMKEVITWCTEPILVNPATSTAGEGSFSTARTVKKIALFKDELGTI